MPMQQVFGTNLAQWKIAQKYRGKAKFIESKKASFWELTKISEKKANHWELTKI